MQKLNPKIKYDRKWHELVADTRCHLDPDLNKNILKRDEKWTAAFGQTNQSQSHLANEGVKEGDLFLFFGWFRETVLKNGVLKFNTSALNLHVIFGYLQIGSIYNKASTCVPDSIKNHCHVVNEIRREKQTNTVYIASDKLSWDESMPGAGVFDFDKKLVLTKKGEAKSRWDLPECFRNGKVRISRHTADAWRPEGYFQSVPIGQEIVIEDNEQIEAWAKSLFLAPKGARPDQG